MTGVIKIQEEDSSSATASAASLQHFSLMRITPSGSAFLGDVSSADRGLFLIHLLVNCCKHVAARDFTAANAFLEHISVLASPEGDTMQRMASYFTDALACRLLKSLPGVYRALQGTKPPSHWETHVVKRHFFDLCPFLKLSVVVANKAIYEAMEGEKMVHIIDLHAWDSAQWVALLHMFSSRPDGPPHLRITAVHEQKEVLDQTASRLTEAAEQLDVPFQFNPVVSTLENLDPDTLRVKTGEALAISSILQLHQLLATSSSSSSDDEHYRSRKPPTPTSVEAFLTMAGAFPKVVVVAEQESNHNRPILGERFAEALNYYAALFDCLESTLPRSSLERGKVESLLFGGQIRNIIACEGRERKTRHERLPRWVARMELAGFRNMPFSYDALCQARALLHTFTCNGYKVREDNGCFFLCWQNHALFSLSAWNSVHF